MGRAHVTDPVLHNLSFGAQYVHVDPALRTKMREAALDRGGGVEVGCRATDGAPQTTLGLLPLVSPCTYF